MSILVYKWIHLLGLILLMTSLGTLTGYTYLNGAKRDSFKRALTTVHGISMFLLLLGGFGLLARLGIHWPWPGWVIVKLIIWVLLGGAVAGVTRLQAKGWMLTLIVVLASLASYLALYKPF